MDIISFGLANKVKKWVQTFNANPGSDYGINTFPNKIDNSETISIPTGRQVVLGELTIEDGSSLDIEDGGVVNVVSGGSITKTTMRTENIENVAGNVSFSVEDVADSFLLTKSISITPDADTDYTLTVTENKYGRLVLADGSWTATHNIIVDNTERSFLVDNSAGTYTATVKTSAGTGIEVLAGTKVWLLCDGTNVIESTDAEVAWVANDSRAKTALNASGTAPIYACRAFCNFNGFGTIAIRKSGNVSSITDIGTGVYDANLIVALPDTTFTILLTTGYVGVGGDTGHTNAVLKSPLATNKFRIYVYNDGDASVDVDSISFALID